jgi:hypothetical protein
MEWYLPTFTPIIDAEKMQSMISMGCPSEHLTIEREGETYSS